eukprot:m.36980 g.36980  ORF g.36980 m.36980 type:complete len:477 (-) comp11067_c1_seq1:76-1506(-)
MDEGKSALTDLLPTSVSEPAAAMDTSEDKPASDVAATSAGDGDDTAMPKADGKKRKKPAEDDGDEGSDSDDEDRPAPLLDQDLALPTGSRRQRKAPQRLETGFHITAEFKTSDIAAGKGKKLGDIPNILFHTKDVPSGEARLCLLHRVLYGRDGKHTVRKKNIREFSGWPAAMTKEDKASKKELLLRRQRGDVAQVAKYLDLPVSGTREELADEIVDFLEKPKKLGSRNLMEAYEKKVSKKRRKAERAKKTKGKKKPTASKKKKPKKEAKAKPDPPKPAVMFYASAAAAKVKEDHPDLSEVQLMKEVRKQFEALSEDERKPYEEEAKQDQLRYENELEALEKDESDDGEDDEDSEDVSSSDDEEEEEPPKKAAPKKKAPAKKKPAKAKASPKKATKKARSEPVVEDSSDSSSDEEEGLAVVKLKANLKKSIAKILKGADLDSVTTKMIRKQLQAEYEEDLAPHKEFIKSAVMAAIA